MYASADCRLDAVRASLCPRTARATTNALQWDPSWSIELTNLLSVLTQLIALEDQMNDVLQDIVVGPLLTRSALAERGVSYDSRLWMRDLIEGVAYLPS